MDENEKSLANLQEAFRGSLDPEVVDLILTESNYIVDDALEKLLSISKSVSSSDLSPNSKNKSAKEDCATSIESNSPRPNERNSFKGNRKAHKASSFKDDKSDSMALLSKSVDHSDVDIYSSVNVTNREIPLDSSEKHSHSIEKGMGPRDLSLFDHSHQRTNSAFHGVQSGIEVTDQAVLPNELPPWPDYNQGYLHHMHSFSGQPSNLYQGLPIHTNFQGQRFTGDAEYFHYMPQHQFQQNMGTYHPRSSFHVPRIRYPPVGWYPGQVTPQNGAHFKKNKFQPHFGMQKSKETKECSQKEERQIFSKNQTRSEETFLPPGKVLLMLRGLPGSGKTTLAQKLKGDGLILSTDDFFLRNGKYQYEQNDLSEAHEWNQKRAKESMQKGVSPVIIDNTNTQAWEMRPYVSMGRRFGYKVIIKEPNTPWKWNIKELLKRNQHQVTLFSIQNMKERYEKDLTVEAILTTNRKENENVNLMSEICHSNKDNSECVKPMSVAPKERNRNKETPYNKFIEQPSSADVSSLGTTVQSQFENQRNKQVKPSVAQPKPFSSGQLGNQGFKYSKARSQDTWPEMKSLRSHGSRSPIQDIDFSLAQPSQDGESLDEINETFDKIGISNTEVNFDETLLPKPQRTPKRRERASKLLESEGQNNQEVKENPDNVLDSREAKTNQQGSRAVSENDEEEDGDDNVQGLITRVANGENSFTHYSRNEIHLDHGQEEQEISFLRKDVVASKSAIERNSMISSKKEPENTEPLLPKNLTTDESINKEFSLEKYLPKDIRKSENDKDEQKDVKAEDYSLAKTNDWNESFKSTRIASGFLNREEKTETEKEHSLENFQNDLSESDLSGFQFLNTCFPDTDIQFLVDILAKNQGDVTKAVESILCHEDSSSEVELSREKDSSDMDAESEKLSMQTSSSQRKSAYVAPDQDMKPLRGYQVQESRTANSLQSANKSFQMTLEPAVAIHLLELFGPIDSVSLEGDFSSDALIVKVDSDFAKLLYNQWRTTIQNDTEEKLFYAGKQPQVSRTKRKEDSDKIFKEIQPKHSLEHRKTTDLRQIMDEQMAIEQSRQEQEQTTESMAVVLKRQKLYAMFPGVDPLALEELFEANRYELQPTISMVETSCNLQAKLSEFQEKESNRNTRSCDDDLGELKTEFQALQDPDYVDFRAEANTHYKLRDECFRKAAFAFSKKQGQLAQFYASQGHMHTEKIRQANRRAAARILEYKNSSMDQNSLDLHGLHVDEALSALEEKLLFSDSQQNHARYLSVITGQGIHSKQGKAKIKPAVVEYLQRNNYRFEELQPGLLRVYVKR